MQSRYYDAEIRRFINADNVGVVSGEYLTTIGGQNLYSYCLNNPVNHADPSGHLIGAIIGLVVSLVFLGLAVYGLIEAVRAFIKEPSWLNLLFVVIAVVDVVLSAIAVLQAFKALQATLKVAGKKALRTSAQNRVTGEKLPNSQGGECNPGKCFIAGTKVKTEDGYKNIEEVEVGDKVLAYDEETGKQAYKEVVRLFRGKTEEWYHVFAEGEEIVCTGGHRFYVEGKGFVEAKDLTEEDKLTLSDGRQVKIEKIEKEELAKAETKYNFEVKDFHTYYVTENDVLVHNTCQLDPNDIYYTQDSIGRKFSDGRSVDDMITGLKNGSITADDVPAIRVFEQDGKIFTLDNRRLYAFKQAGMSQINVRWVNPSAPNIVRELAWKFTTINGGRSIRLR